MKAFIESWSAPRPDDLLRLLTDDVHLVQPMSSATTGIGAAKKWLEGVLATMPDIRAEVDRWSASGECLFIEFRLIATIGSREPSGPSSIACCWMTATARASA